jgi:hypothetical protein
VFVLVVAPLAVAVLKAQYRLAVVWVVAAVVLVVSNDEIA